MSDPAGRFNSGYFLFHHAGDFGGEIVFTLLNAFALGKTAERLHGDLGAERFGNVRNIGADGALKHVGTDERLIQQADLLDLLGNTAVDGLAEDGIGHEFRLAGHRDGPFRERVQHARRQHGLRHEDQEEDEE